MVLLSALASKSPNISDPSAYSHAVADEHISIIPSDPTRRLVLRMYSHPPAFRNSDQIALHNTHPDPGRVSHPQFLGAQLNPAPPQYPKSILYCTSALETYCGRYPARVSCSAKSKLYRCSQVSRCIFRAFLAAELPKSWWSGSWNNWFLDHPILI
jgi:hypothetical protein